jgi:hypothetical protein
MRGCLLNVHDLSFPLTCCWLLDFGYRMLDESLRLSHLSLRLLPGALQLSTPIPAEVDRKITCNPCPNLSEELQVGNVAGR